MGKPEKNLPFVLVFVGIISVIFLSQIFSNQFRTKILGILRAPFSMISGSYYVLRDVNHFNDLRMENRILSENISNLKKKILDLEEFRLENERLRKLLDFGTLKKSKFVPAMVIAKDPSGLQDTIVINKGKRHGVQEDMAVVSGDGLVGRVRESGWTIARVVLVTDRNSVVSAIVQRTRDEGAAVGNAWSGLIMKYLELNADVKEGDKVVTSGFGGIFEKGILIGEVVSVRIDPTGLYLDAIIKPEVDIPKLEEVLVMR